MADLISRAAAIEALGERPYNWTDSESEISEVCAWENHKSAIENIPSVDAVPVVQGEWIEEPDRVGHYHCSNCGVVWEIAAKAMKYCPNCAAKMMNSPIWEVGDAK